MKWTLFYVFSTSKITGKLLLQKEVKAKPVFNQIDFSDVKTRMSGYAKGQIFEFIKCIKSELE